MTTAETNGGASGLIPIERYVASSHRLDLEGIDFGNVKAVPLSDEVIKTLVYMADIEGSTITFLRDVCATAVIDDPDTARFLTLWAYEEMFHQEALAKFLDAYGVPLDKHRVAQLRSKQTLGDRFMMKLSAWMSHLTSDFVPIYLTWGAINELSTLNAYKRLGEQSKHPVLAALLTRIVKDERRHFSFYYNRARVHLERSASARRWVSWAVRLFWRPVGDGLKSKAEIDLVLRELLAGDDGLKIAQQMDTTIAQLPGLAWFTGWKKHHQRLSF